MFQEIINRIKESIDRIPPQILGYLIMGVALWFITTSAIGLASILPEILSGEEVDYPPFILNR